MVSSPCPPSEGAASKETTYSSHSFFQKQKEKRKHTGPEDLLAPKKSKTKVNKAECKQHMLAQEPCRDLDSTTPSVPMATLVPTPSGLTAQAIMQVTPPGSPQRISLSAPSTLDCSEAALRGSMLDGKIQDSPPHFQLGHQSACSPTLMPSSPEVSPRPPSDMCCHQRALGHLSRIWVPMPYGRFDPSQSYPWDYPPPYGYYPLPLVCRHRPHLSRAEAPSTSAAALSRPPPSPAGSSCSPLYHYDLDLEDSDQASTSPDAVISTQGPGLLEELYPTFGDLMVLLARSLEIEVEHRVNTNEDHFYDIVRKEQSSAISIPLIMTLCQAVTDTWEFLSQPHPTSRCYESMCKVREQDIPFLLKHPKLNSLVVKSLKG
ncbi:GDP-mannose 4,6 dehydratase isoform X2 [Varanus komodoensis]|uniref:GDP-mannose 4,6 dehydratase isoform X2 n=1 Tax=Varanus komodoensis TaxID=61221 RepID=UPI001CF79570|nr:GDP-mannose 4,6 dehydratase isoform X2 [Varanus komodoensis]